MSLGVLVLIVSIVVFSGVTAFLAFERYGDSLLTKWLGAGKPPRHAAPVALIDPPAKSTAAAAKPALAEDVEAPAAPVEDGTAAEALPVESEPTGAEAEEADGQEAEAEPDPSADGALRVPPPNPATDARPTIAPAHVRRTEARHRPRPEPVAAPPPKDDSANDEDEKVLREFRSTSNAGPAQIEVKKSDSTDNDAPPLDGAGVRATVSANKARLQRCYERAIRGQQSTPSVRLDVTVMVASSGRVKDVSAEGSAPGGLAECVAASVRRWRFPASSEGGPASFPIVFSAN